MIRLVEQSEMPLDYALEEATSPNGEWTATMSSTSIELLSRDGYRKTINVGGTSGPWWSPDSTQLAFVSDRRLIAIDLDGRILAFVEEPGWSGWRFVGWTDVGISWLLSTLGQQSG